jgi:hypothetical protein
LWFYLLENCIDAVCPCFCYCLLTPMVAKSFGFHQPQFNLFNAYNELACGMLSHTSLFAFQLSIVSCGLWRAWCSSNFIGRYEFLNKWLWVWF